LSSSRLRDFAGDVDAAPYPGANIDIATRDLGDRSRVERPSPAPMVNLDDHWSGNQRRPAQVKDAGLSDFAAEAWRRMVEAPRKPLACAKAVGEKSAGLAGPPNWIEPCIPTLVDRPPSGPNWRHEVKWDGYRLCVVVAGGNATARTRRGHDWSHRFRSIVDAAAALSCQNAVIDGEAVVLDEQGHASFAALQSRLDGATRAEVVLHAFDLLFLDGRDLRERPLSERRA
jgi:hypothetical protein